MSDLSFFTTHELIEEIMTRDTFLGIVIKSVNEVTTCGENMAINPGGFEVRCKNMSPDQAASLLSGVSECIGGDLNDWESDDLQ